MFPSRCAGIEHFLLKLAPDLPDMDLVINTRDYPQSSKHFGGPLPIFSFSKVNKLFINNADVIKLTLEARLSLLQFVNLFSVLMKSSSIAKCIYRRHNIMILHIQRGRFGKADLQFLCIPVALEGGTNIASLQTKPAETRRGKIKRVKDSSEVLERARSATV